MDLTRFNWVLHDFTGLYQVLLGFTWFSLGFTWFHQGYDGFYWVPMGLTRFNLVL